MPLSVVNARVAGLDIAFTGASVAVDRVAVVTILGWSFETIATHRNTFGDFPWSCIAFEALLDRARVAASVAVGVDAGERCAEIFNVHPGHLFATGWESHCQSQVCSGGRG